MERIFLLLVTFIILTHTTAANANGVTGHEPSYITYTSRFDSAADLDNSLRAHLSFRYDFEKVPFIGKEINNKVFFTYTGDFDFYWMCGNCRESDPVIARVFNPALHWRTLDTDGRYLELSVHHRSNGQVTNAQEKDADGNFIAETEFRLGNNAYLDSISRSSNYLQLETKFPLTKKDVLYLRWRPVFGPEDSTQTWRVSEPTQADIADYDRFEVIYSRNISCKSRMQATWSFGDKGLATDSLDIGLQYNWKGLPIYVNAHHGPMETLSDHTRSVSSVGLGLVFWRIFGNGC